MNSYYQTLLDIKHSPHTNNPFILKLPANSTSQQQINLSTSAHILKKLSLIDIFQSKQLTDLYKQCLLDVVQSPLLDLKDEEIINQLLYFLQYWHVSLGKYASWLHTRTCFYYLEDKLKRGKLFVNLDMVRLKRAELEPNKKDFLNQIMGQNVHSQQLKQFISELKQQSEYKSQNGSVRLKSQIKQENNKPNLIKQQNLQISRNILYQDTKQDWLHLQITIKLLKKQNKQYKLPQTNLKQIQQSQQKINSIFQTYIVQKLPIFLNIMKAKKLSKQKIIQQLNYRKQIIQSLGIRNQYMENLNMVVSRIVYNL